MFSRRPADSDLRLVEIDQTSSHSPLFRRAPGIIEKFQCLLLDQIRVLYDYRLISHGGGDDDIDVMAYVVTLWKRRRCCSRSLAANR
jgi:hypothetical protein